VALRALPRFVTNRAETEPKTAPGPFVTDPAAYDTAPASGLRITWFGHSSLLYEMDGVRLLVDPVWDQRASPVTWAGPKRFFPPTIPLERLPVPDAVLLSHDHYDHLGAHTVRTLAGLAAWKQTRWITMLGVGAELEKFGVLRERITELDWTQSVELASVTDPEQKLNVTAWPARHFSGRSLFNRFQTLWGSFVLEGAQHRVYHGADSGTWEGFAPIAAQYDGFDLIALEIGAYDPLWAAIHLGPDAAAQAFTAMRDAGKGSRVPLFLPIHWGLFNLALHAWRQPMERLEEIAAPAGIPLWSPQPGVPTEPSAPHVAEWWRRR
jgi:L-ascorbate metabolism protein UlaG (beta-lactamase superfamily)